MVTCSGAHADGSLRIVRNGIGMIEQATVELAGGYTVLLTLCNSAAVAVMADVPVQACHKLLLVGTVGACLAAHGCNFWWQPGDNTT